jgi:hypothetical protein
VYITGRRTLDDVGIVQHEVDVNGIDEWVDFQAAFACEPLQWPASPSQAGTMQEVMMAGEVKLTRHQQCWPSRTAQVIAAVTTTAAASLHIRLYILAYVSWFVYIEQLHERR